MIKSISFTLLLFFYFDSLAQKGKPKVARLLTDHAEWFEGSIMLTNDTELKGLVKYNSKNGILSYQDGTESKVFTPSRVTGFEFFDESLQKQRIFYTLMYEDSETNVVRPLFFEALKEYKTFAVLSKSDRVDIGLKTDPVLRQYDPYSNTANRSETVISQTETIYIMNATGEIKPYFKVVNIEDGRRSIRTGKDEKTASQMIDRDLLEEFTTPSEYQHLKKYSKDNDLNFKIKEDFLKILNYYDEIIRK